MCPIIWDMSRGHVTCDMPLFREGGGRDGERKRDRGGESALAPEREREKARTRERESQVCERACASECA